MYIRSIEPRDRDFFLSRNAAFYRSSACDHAIPPQNAERTFELLLHGTPYADCLIAEDDDGAPCAYLLLALTWSNEAGGLCVWLDELMVDETVRRALPAGGDRKQCARRRAVPDARLRGAGLPPDDYGHAGRPVSRTEPQFKAAAFSLPVYLL